MQAKTVLMITLDTSPGGIEQSLITYINTYHALGYAILLYVPAGASIISKLSALHLPQLKINTFSWLALKLSVLCPFFASDLSRACQASDRIFAHNARLIPVLKQLAKKHAPVIFIDHASKARAETKQADYVITLSTAAQTKLITQYPELQSRSSCIYHAIELPAESAYQPNELPHIVTAGRLVEKKGFICFINAIALLRDQKLNFKVTLAGDGPQKDLLQNLITTLNLSNIVSLPGWVSDPIALFQSADIVCLPSLIEPFGLSLAEAMACGRACVTTDCEGPLDIVGNSEAAIIVAKNSSEALANALKELLLNPDKRLKLATKARAQIANNFSMTALKNKLAKL